MRRLFNVFTAILAVLCLAAGCARPTAQATPYPDAALLAGLWQQFVPVGSLPQQIMLDASGSAGVDGEAGRWRLEGGDLYLRRGGRETRYSYTLSGYMLTLFDLSSGTSGFYINPDTFEAQAEGNAKLKGQWAAWSTFSKMAFDGDTGLTTIVYTTAGRTELPARYAARDGILQSVDAGGNHTYNLYSFGADGALLLAETTEYDSDNRQWTAYWQAAEPPAALLGDWTKAVGTEPGGEGLPAALRLDAGGKGSAAAGGQNPSFMKWEYYAGGFVLLELSETNLQYAWCTPGAGALSLGNPELDEAWYIDRSRFKPDAAPLPALAGTWKPEGEDKPSLVFSENGTVEIINGAGKRSVMAASAAGGVLELKYGGKTYYMAYSVDNGTMQLYYKGLPFLEDRELPVLLNKA